MHPRRFATVCILILTALVLTTLLGCGSSAPAYVSPASAGTASGGMPEPTATPAAAARTFATPGERIYATGVGENGQSILRQAPQTSMGAMLMGGGGCAACHGANGKGGKVQTANGAAIDSPNITYADLKKNGFTDETIRNAILFCTDEAGAKLDEAMPCWQMNDKDVVATVAYLKLLK